MSATSTPRFGTLYRSLLWSAVLPLALVLVLQHRFGVSLVIALAIAAVFPLADIAAGWYRSRRLQPLGALMLVGNAARQRVLLALASRTAADDLLVRTPVFRPPATKRRSPNGTNVGSPRSFEGACAC
ncbi:MAG: hypothetical protein ACRENA_07930 [Vulcanimicrobiaceae bacterium]